MLKSLAIVIPTHNRQDTVQKVSYKLVDYYAEKCDLNIFILDSSLTPAVGINGDCITYIHCPGKNPVAKAKYCAELIVSSYPDVGWILYTPDDDLYIPNGKTLGQLFSISLSEPPLEYSYVPSRYIMFKTLNKNNNIISLQECWTHHCNIASSKLTPREQLENFTSEGVASYWGLYSRGAFLLATVFRYNLLQILPQSCVYIIEDLSNILMLSFNWIAINDPLICLRGDDRRFRKSKAFMPSWKAFAALQQNQNKMNLLSISSLLCGSINKVLSKSGSFQSYPDISDCVNLISLHVNGYMEGRSRLYNLNVPVVLQSKSCSTNISFYKKGLKLLNFNIPFARRKNQMIALPCDRSDLDTNLYPNSHIFGDERVVDMIYENKAFLFSHRDS